MARRHNDVSKKDRKTTSRFLSLFSAGGLARDAPSDTGEEMEVLNKIKEYRDFFRGLEADCSDVENVNSNIKEALTALRSMYILCKSQKYCRDTFLSLVEEMDDILNYRNERLGSILRESPSGRVILKTISDIVEEISILLEEQNRGTTSRFLRNINSTSYDLKLKVVRDKLKRAKESLKNSINRDLESKKRMMLDELRMKLGSVPEAHYSPGECCLEDTRTNLLTEVDTWIRGASSEKTAWVYGHVGSGKSALFNSIAENLNNADIPFTCFPFKWGDSDLSNVHRVLPTISYRFAEAHDDYRNAVHDVLQGHSVSAEGIKKQSELLFGKSYEMVTPEESSRPPVHVILIDALDECRNHRNRDETVHERHDLTEVLLDFANTVPWIKVLITSRPEPDIANVFKDSAYTVRQIDINSDKWCPTPAAMRHFLLVTSEGLDLNLSYDRIERFREKASGFFLWYMVVFRYIRGKQESRKHVIESILEEPSAESHDASLYLLYRRVLDLAISEAQDKDLMESILRVIFIASTRQPLSATALTNMLYPEKLGEGPKKKRKQADIVIRSLSAILHVDERSQVVRACHSTALDFIIMILSEDGLMRCSQKKMDLIQPFSIGPEEMHARMLDRCLATMKRELRFNICDLEDPHQLNKDVADLPVRIDHKISKALRQASLLWAFHLGGCNKKESSQHVHTFLNSSLVLFWIETLSLLDAIYRGIAALKDCARCYIAESNIAGIANEWELFLLSYSDALKSTPHLYLSALSWILGSSPLWDIVHGSFSSELPMVSNVPEIWKGERWSESVDTDVRSVAYSPDGRLFAAGCEDGSVRFWEELSRKKEKPFITESPVEVISFSPNGQWLASGHEDGTVCLWELRKEPASPIALEHHAWTVCSVVFSSDGTRLLSGSKDGSIRVWDVESGRAVGAPFRRLDYNVTSVTFSADEARVVSASSDNTVRIWSAESGEQIGEPLQGHSDTLYSVACSRDGRLIVCGSDHGIILLWDAHTFRQTGKLEGHTDNVNAVCFSFDSKRIVSGSDDHSVRIWNVDTRSVISELKGHTERVTAVVFLLDGYSVLSGSEDNTVRIWGVRETALFGRPPAGRHSRFSCVSYVPGGNEVVSGSREGRLDIWDAHTGAALGNTMRGHTDAINALAVSRDGQWLVSGSDDRTIRIWNLASERREGEPMLDHTDRVSSVAISPDNQLVASASSDRTVRLWDVATREPVKTLKGHEGKVSSVTFSADGNNVISSSWDETIRIWDTRTGEAIGQPLRGHSGIIYSTAISLDGRWIASGSYDKTVRVWDVSRQTAIHVLRGHSGPVTSVSFSPNSQFLVSGSYDETVKLWNVQSGQAVGDALQGHSGNILSLSFASDGYEFASASMDGTIHVWDTLVRTDLEIQKENGRDYSQQSEEELRIEWNSNRARMAVKSDGWVRDGENLVLWVPRQYRNDIKSGCRLIIGAQDMRRVRPQVDYQKMFKYSGMRWKGVYTTKNA